MRRVSSGDTIDVAVGDRFEVVLNEPGATGYLFEPANVPRGVAIENSRREPGHRPGASGTVVFETCAQAEGLWLLTFELRAPFDPASAETATVKVRVRAR